MHNSLSYRSGAYIRKFLLTVFYPLFRRICSEQLFVYGVCGVSNTFFSWVLYWFSYNFILSKENLDLGILVLKPHIGAFVIQFVITFVSGFWLNRYVTFSDSTLKKRVQVPRYLSIVVGCIFINYFCLKLFVEVMGIYPTPSQMLSTVIMTIFSFFTQRNYAFRAKWISLEKHYLTFEMWYILLHLPIEFINLVLRLLGENLCNRH